jgi:hypothetical protein
MHRARRIVKPGGIALRRLVFMSALLCVFMVGGFAVLSGPHTAAQDASTPVAPAAGIDMATHPIVGAWALTGESGFAEAVNSYHADGILMVTGRGGTGNEGGLGQGSWVPTGPRTVATTAVVNAKFQGTNVIIIQKGNIEVDETGNNFVATGVFEVRAIDGTPMIAAPVRATGERIVVQPVDMSALPPASPTS